MCCDSFWLWIGRISNVIGVLGAFAAFGALKRLREMDKQKAPVSIVLKDKDDQDIQEKFKITMRRRELNRPELLGRLGMFRKDQRTQFSIQHLSQKRFVEELEEVAIGKQNTLIIPCTKEELEQFVED
jgi:hypothetical protein